jgi:hypothetical protein
MLESKRDELLKKGSNPATKRLGLIMDKVENDEQLSK